MLKTKKQCQQSYVNTTCKSIRVTILIIFRFVRRRMVFSNKESTCADNMKLYTAEIAQAFIKIMSQKW